MDTVPLSDSAQLAYDAILGNPTTGIPIWLINPMEHRMIDRIAGLPEGSYRRDPEPTYRRMMRNAGCILVDQYIPENPLTMGDAGYEHETQPLVAGVGGGEIWVDGMRIDSPDAVADHIERFHIPYLQSLMREFDESARTQAVIADECGEQQRMGSDFLKNPYGCAFFPTFDYGRYGYENYFMAYALYPDVIERLFAAQADYALLNNRAVLRAIREAGLPPLIRLDYDMADSRGTLVDIQTLDRLWFPHFARCLEPLLHSEVKLIWHCDGNLSQMVPRLLDVGLKGFQGFQYEDGMDYERICAMRTKDGEPLLIIAGVSVTRTLPWGTPDEVRREMKWLVENGPRAGLILGCSSSIAPGVPWENIQALIKGFHYYRTQGRG